MTATDEPRIHSTPATSRRARREVEQVSFDELIAGLDEGDFIEEPAAPTALAAPTPVPGAASVADPAPVAASATPAPVASAAQSEPKSARTHANATPAEPVRAPQAERPARAETDAHHPKGRFYRPELYSTTQRITGSIVVKVSAVVLLLAGTAALVVLALGRFS